MKNSLILLAVVLTVAAFAGMMRIKTDVQTMDRQRLQLVRERAELRETKRVLEAEWALLASPNRMERVVKGEPYRTATALDVIPLAEALEVSATAAVAGSAVMAAVQAGLVSVTEASTAEAAATSAE